MPYEYLLTKLGKNLIIEGKIVLKGDCPIDYHYIKGRLEHAG